MKNKNIFLLSFFVAGLLLSFGVQKAFADTCSAQKAGFACINTSKVTGATGCVTNLCPGTAASVKCCALSSVVCKSDGSSSLQPCSASGNYGLCNAAGVCVDSQTGPISTTVTTTVPAGSTTFTNPLEFTTVEGFLGGIMTAIQKIIVVLALVFIMIGSVMILISAGNPKMVEQGKGAITMALVGVALGVAAPSLLKELARIIGWGDNCAGIADAGIKAACLAKEQAVGGALTLSQIAVNVLNFLLGSMGILALIMLVIGAILYLTSAGDDDRIKKGKEIFKNAAFGLIMAMSAMVLVTQIAKFFTTSAAPVIPAASTTTTGVCAGKAVGTACHAVSDSISWDGTCNAAGSCQQ